MEATQLVPEETSCMPQTSVARCRHRGSENKRFQTALQAWSLSFKAKQAAEPQNVRMRLQFCAFFKTFKLLLLLLVGGYFHCLKIASWGTDLRL